MAEEETKKSAEEKASKTNIDEAREHMNAATSNMRKVVESMFPEGMRESEREARKEFLLGLRSLIDATIEFTEKHPK
jgi:signal transduction histidine kinase